MPDIGGEIFADGDVSIPVNDPTNILGFTTNVEGRPVRAAVEQRAIARGVDRAAWLRTNGISLAIHHDDVRRQIARLPGAKLAEAEKLGLIDADRSPLWILKTTYHWQQTFPADRPITIEHAYKPSVGSTVMTSLGMRVTESANKVRRYCVEPTLLDALTRSARAHDGSAPYYERWIDYVLTTGGNWREPIGSFRLVVDKEKPDTLVSFCGSGVRKIGPTQFEMRRTNWRPDRDLAVLLLEPRGR